MVKENSCPDSRRSEGPSPDGGGESCNKNLEREDIRSNSSGAEGSDTLRSERTRSGGESYKREIPTDRRAWMLVNYDIEVMKGEQFNAPIWLVISDVERDIERLERDGYDRLAKILRGNLATFKKRCEGHAKDKPLKEVIGSD